MGILFNDSTYLVVAAKLVTSSSWLEHSPTNSTPTDTLSLSFGLRAVAFSLQPPVGLCSEAEGLHEHPALARVRQGAKLLLTSRQLSDGSQ